LECPSRRSDPSPAPACSTSSSSSSGSSTSISKYVEVVSKKTTSTSRFSSDATLKKTDSCTRSEHASRKSIAR